MQALWRWRALHLIPETWEGGEGGDHAVSITEDCNCAEADSSSRVCKHLTEFVLSRAQPFPVKWLEVCLSPLCSPRTMGGRGL